VKPRTTFCDESETEKCCDLTAFAFKNTDGRCERVLFEKESHFFKPIYFPNTHDIGFDKYGGTTTLKSLGGNKCHVENGKLKCVTDSSTVLGGFVAKIEETDSDESFHRSIRNLLATIEETRTKIQANNEQMPSI
jgi:hypothetical protein